MSKIVIEKQLKTHGSKQAIKDNTTRVTIPQTVAKICDIAPDTKIKIELRQGKHGYFIALYNPNQQKKKEVND